MFTNTVSLELWQEKWWKQKNKTAESKIFLNFENNRFETYTEQNAKEHQMSTARQQAAQFIEHQRAFRLGTLLTESPHPKTAELSQVIQENMTEGIRLLLHVDEEIAPAASKIFAGDEFQQLVTAMTRAFGEGRKVFFTGCGATGRLSILLEAMWREFWQRARRDHSDTFANLPDYENSVISVMAGGDFAMIKSVEGFEDFPRFGKHQLLEAGVEQGDVVVAITEGGETPFVIGTAWQGLESGAEVFFVFNNPAELLCEHVERSREVIEDERITCLDLTTGPMAITGSTRMQATSCELLVVGAALETALKNVLQKHLPAAALASLGCDSEQSIDDANLMCRLVQQLCEPAALSAMGQLTQFEQDIYEQKGLITYAASDFLLDVLTDTTERSPTFSLPAYRKSNDETSAVSWVFVKNPLLGSVETWRESLRRTPRGLNWNAERYSQLEAPASIQSNPPALDNNEIHRFPIGNERDQSRFDCEHSAWIMIAVGDEVFALNKADSLFCQQFEKEGHNYQQTATVCVGPKATQQSSGEMFHVPVDIPSSPIKLWEHLAIKLVLNTVSTATMARMNRVIGNWMVHVSTSNKKLIDRGTRLIAELSGLSYEESCLRLHETMEEIKPYKNRTRETTSPVALTLKKLGHR